MVENENDRTMMNSRIPTILTLRDVFLMMTAVVSVALAWGMFGTRLSVVEEKMLSTRSTVAEVRQLIKEVREETKQARMEKHVEIAIELQLVEDRLRQVENRYGRLEGLMNHSNVP